MNMKDTVILLIILLSILGIMLGINHEGEGEVNTICTPDGTDVVIQNSDGSITIIHHDVSEDNDNYCIS